MEITKGVIAKAQKVVIYGPEGIGKTTLASHFPNPVFIDTEGSTDNMDVARLPKPSSWTHLMEEISFVKANRPCTTLVIDTIDWAERLAIEHTCQVENKTSIEDFGYGTGYVKVQETVGKLLNILQDLVDSGINVVLTAHTQIRKFEQPDEMGAYDRYELKLGKKTQNQTSALVKEWADMILFCNYQVTVATSQNGKKKAQGGQRVMFTTHTPSWDAKNRFQLPDQMPMDYASIAPIFDTLPNAQSTQNVQPIPQPTAPMPNDVPPVAQEPTPDPREAEATTTPFPQQPAPTEPATPEPQQPVMDESIPKPLADLMTTKQITPEEIMNVVSQKGYYPAGTPISNYDPGFIQGVLVGAWEQVSGAIIANREGAK
jgi:energy-coupling factor transporter ATP-binding protein EcfA2